MTTASQILFIRTELLLNLQLLLSLFLLSQLDLLDSALEHLSLFNRCLSVLTLSQELLDESLGEVLRLSCGVERKGDLRD